MNRERTEGEGPRHEGILLYPTVGEETRVGFETHGYRFQARSIDLTKSSTEIHRCMLEAVDLADPLSSQALRYRTSHRPGVHGARVVSNDLPLG